MRWILDSIGIKTIRVIYSESEHNILAKMTMMTILITKREMVMPVARMIILLIMMIAAAEAESAVLLKEQIIITRHHHHRHRVVSPRRLFLAHRLTDLQGI